MSQMGVHDCCSGKFLYPMESSKKCHVLIGCTGSVASVKLPELLKQLLKQAIDGRHMELKVIATKNSFHFIPMQEMPTNVTVYTDEDEWSMWKEMSDPVLHIQLRRWADALVVAPIDANTMGKIANGLCDNLLTPLDIHNESTPLWEANIHSGDTLILEVLKDAVVPCMPEDEKEYPDSVKTSPPLVPTTTTDVYQLAAFESGIMMRHVVPSNNSCLFASIYYILTSGDENVDKANEFRYIIAKTVQKDTDKYNSAILGMNPHDYCSWIMNPNHWGGGIELAILSEHLKLEICAIDTLSLTMHRFGENEGYDRRIFLIYDGIHYDPLVMELSENIQGAFQTNDNKAIDLAMEVAREAKSSRQFTDVANFTLKCLACGLILRGDNEAREHAKQTKHVDFGEE